MGVGWLGVGLFGVRGRRGRGGVEVGWVGAVREDVGEGDWVRVGLAVRERGFLRADPRPLSVGLGLPGAGVPEVRLSAAKSSAVLPGLLPEVGLVPCGLLPEVRLVA